MSTQPIALPGRSSSSGARNAASTPTAHGDVAMGSLTGSTGNGSFNPASYTRHFLGSPISWRASSFGAGSRIFGSPMDTAMGSPSKTPSVDSNVRNAYGIFEKESEFCRDYSCCGLHLNDLHALLEHFEEVHVVVIDPQSPQAQLQIPFNPQVGTSQTHTGSQSAPDAQHHSYDSAFDPDEMDMEDPPPSATPSARSSPGVLTPPDTPLSSFATPAINGQPPSPTSAVSAFDTKTFLRRGAPNGANGTQPTPNRLTLNLSFPSHNQGSHPGTPLSPHVDPFNTYGRYAGEYSNDNSSGSTTAVEECVPPALLFSTNASPESTPSTSRLPSPQAPPADASAVPPTKASPPSSAAPKALKVTVPTPQATNNQDPLRPTPASLGRPTASLLLSKPFKCPRPNCNKSYKQANGLKYHMTHGTCNFAPPKDLEQVQALLERKRRDRAAAVAAGQIEEGPADSGIPNNSPYGEITDAELREVEREAERRLRPFACGVGDCTRRYKNMNGLRYHYQHSGEHGAIGLAMLASGVHECLNNSGHGRESSAARAEREGRKRASNKSSPTSRATSLSRVDSAPATPTTATGPARPAYAPPPVQYSNQVSYQQRYADHQRPPFQQQPPPPPPPHYAPPPLEAYQPPQQPQYASMMYTPNSVGVDVGMVG